MPKTAIDYSKALIYKICCLDPNVKEIYVGSTTNFRERVRGHKKACNDEKNKDHNIKLYQFIRANGGWDNWTMELIEFYITDDKLKLLKREGELIRELKASLNCIISGRTLKQWREDNKDLIIEKKKEYYEDNKNEILKKAKKYSEINKETIAEKQKEYRNNNKEKLAEKKKEYRENNKEKIAKIKNIRYKNNIAIMLNKAKNYRENNRTKVAEGLKKWYEMNKIEILLKAKEKYTCECGSCLTVSHKSKHEKTQKHIKYMESLANVKV